ARFGRDSVAGAEKDPWWIRTLGWFPLGALSWLFLLADVVFFVALGVIRYLPGGFLRTGVIVGNVFVAISGVMIGLLLVGRIYLAEHVRFSIVVADEVVIREGPDPNTREMPKLHAGHRVVILRESQGWYRIQLANRVEGWVHGAAVEEI
ncbi:MAG: SH3 domain-containing protein, partial [Pseudomonadota bacterium]